MIIKFLKNSSSSLVDYKKYLNLPKNKREIIFYAEKESDFVFFKDIIYDLTLNKNIEVTYITSDPNDSILKKKIKNLFKFYIGNIYMRQIFFKTLNTKIFVMTLPGLGDIQIQKSKFSVHYIYIPHTLVSTHMIFKEDAFDNFDTFFCSSNIQCKEIRKMEKIRNKNKKKLLNFGYPRLDNIIEINKKKKDILKSGRKILLAPSWGKNGLFENGAEKIIRFLLERKYYVTIRPHPETLKLNSKIIRNLLSTFKNYNNFSYNPNIYSVEDYFNNNILISDWSGAAFEFAFGTLKPVIFLDRIKKINNNNYEKLKMEPIEVRMRNNLGYIVKENDLNNINKKIKLLLSAQNKWKKKIYKLRKKTVFNIGKSSEVGSNYIYSLYKKL